jgi:4-hydroxy-2-oxovalerate aldolase
MNAVEIMECTLRDGSYIIDYQFTAKDTAIIASALQDVGFTYIEIGHGLGLNASSCKGKAAETDETYLKTAQEVLTKSKYGMFFIPGIGRKEDLDLAARYEMDFVRVGTNVTQADEAEEYIKHAKDLGMIVSSNLMKSYVLPPEDFAEKAKMVDEFGCDIISLVDSSGGMLPHDIRRYIKAMKTKEIHAQIGFHGHNNFSMAVANALEAIENGATIVDSTLKGLGRSAGNAQTEILVTILKKMGYYLDIDEFRVMDLAENLITPFMGRYGGIDPIAITSGYAEFHSSFLGTVLKFSKKYSVDPRRLIMEVCKRDKSDLPEELAERLAEQLYRERAALSEVSKIDVPTAFDMSRERWNNKSNKERASLICEHLHNLSKKTGKQTVFAITISATENDITVVYPSIQESSSYLMATCEMADVYETIEVCKIMDGVDFILVDDEKKRPPLFDILTTIRDVVTCSTVLTYKDNSTWAEGIDNFIASYFKNLYGLKIGIMGLNDVGMKLALSLAERGARIFIFDKSVNSKKIEALNNVKILSSPFKIEEAHNLNELSDNAMVLIGVDRTCPITRKMVVTMGAGMIIDAVFGSVEAEALDCARKKGIQVWRTDMRAAMAGEVTTVLRTSAMIKNMGKKLIAGVPVVSGGYIGDIGDVVVDSILNPTEVIGIADGKGRIMYDKEEAFSDRIRKVELAIIKRRISGEEYDEVDQ